MVTAPTSTPAVTKAAELVVARYNLLGGEDELAKLSGVLTAHTLVRWQKILFLANKLKEFVDL